MTTTANQSTSKLKARDRHRSSRLNKLEKQNFENSSIPRAPAMNPDFAVPLSSSEAQDVDFLASIGASPTEIYDFVEDWSEVGEPSFETILAITAVRYDYFVNEQQRKSPGLVQDPNTFRLGALPWAVSDGCQESLRKPERSLKGSCRLISCSVAEPIAPS